MLSGKSVKPLAVIRLVVSEIVKDDPPPFDSPRAPQKSVLWQTGQSHTVIPALNNIIFLFTRLKATENPSPLNANHQIIKKKI